MGLSWAYRGPNSQRPYEDSIGEDGYPRYKYEGTDADLSTNQAMRAAMEAGLPLAYFVGVRPAVHRPVYRMYVIGESPALHEFALSFARHGVGINLGTLTAPEKVYAARMTRQRLHQPVFREQVLYAYESACAVCQHGHTELLDAAHIIGDAEQGGDPIIPDGMALCKIRDAAYDRNFIGITPNWQVRVNARLLDEVDGPMLKHGLQDMHGASITVPRRVAVRPDPERLGTRFDQFSAAS